MTRAQMETALNESMERERALQERLAVVGPRGENAATLASGASAAPSSGGDKVVVASRLPMGMKLRNFRMVTISELDRQGNNKDVRVAEPQGEMIFIHGVSHPLNEAPRCRIIWGYAFTEGVDKESFDAWMRDNERSAFVVNQLIFAESSFERAMNRAKENEKRRSNMEPLDMENDPRTPRTPENMAPISLERMPAAA